MLGSISRRSLLAGLGICAAAALPGAAKNAFATGKICADPDAMDAGARSMRASLHYVEASANPAQTCAGCAFFRADQDGCGKCQLFNDGPVNSNGHCESWSAKA